jgi:hypothetical protein
MDAHRHPDVSLFAQAVSVSNFEANLLLCNYPDWDSAALVV